MRERPARTTSRASSGGNGNDVLTGNDGLNDLDGGRGADRITGGGGFDQIALRRGDAATTRSSRPTGWPTRSTAPTAPTSRSPTTSTSRSCARTAGPSPICSPIATATASTSRSTATTSTARSGRAPSTARATASTRTATAPTRSTPTATATASPPASTATTATPRIHPGARERLRQPHRRGLRRGRRPVHGVPDTVPCSRRGSAPSPTSSGSCSSISKAASASDHLQGAGLPLQGQRARRRQRAESLILDKHVRGSSCAPARGSPCGHPPRRRRKTVTFTARAGRFPKQKTRCDAPRGGKVARC